MAFHLERIKEEEEYWSIRLFFSESIFVVVGKPDGDRDGSGQKPLLGIAANTNGVVIVALECCFLGSILETC